MTSEIKFDYFFAEQVLGHLHEDHLGETENLISRLANSPAGQHLAGHKRRFSFDAEASARDIVAGLLAPLQECGFGELDKVKLALKQVKRFGREHELWLPDIEVLLPREHEFVNTTVYCTFGYDVGVVSSFRAVSLNVAHPKIYEFPETSNYFLIHELHHAGFLQHQSIQHVAELQTKEQVRSFVLTLTHMEGLGMYAPWSRRRKEDHLGRGDYGILIDDDEMKRLESEYWQLFTTFGLEEDGDTRPGDDWVSKVLEAFGERKKVHLVGCHMARRIERRWGTEALRDTVKKGYERFLELGKPEGTAYG